MTLLISQNSTKIIDTLLSFSYLFPTNTMMSIELYLDYLDPNFPFSFFSSLNTTFTLGTSNYTLFINFK